jgi:hypothetical protein
LGEADAKPMEMSEYYKLDWKFLTRAQSKINDKESLQICFSEFFAQFTLLGFQPSLIVGTKSGQIMKFNSNILDNFMKNEIFGTFNIKSVPAKYFFLLVNNY